MPDDEELSPSALDNWSVFFDEMSAESTRAAVIVGAAFLDGWLYRLLDSAMVADAKARRELLGDDTSQDRVLGSFAARIRAAYCLGLVSKSEYRDLDLIRRIRNRFAHARHGFSFDDQKAADWCDALGLVREISAAAGRRVDRRHQYELGVVLLAMTLQSRVARRGERPAVPKDYSLGKFLQVLADAPQG